MDSKELKDFICEQLDENFGQDITVLNVQHLTVETDYYVICSAKSVRQVGALAELIKDKCEEVGIKASHSDIPNGAKWAVVDFGDIILHVFNDETRLFYSLEKLWSDGQNVEKYQSKR